jgi:hypothetical protein
MTSGVHRHGPKASFRCCRNEIHNIMSKCLKLLDKQLQSSSMIGSLILPRLRRAYGYEMGGRGQNFQEGAVVMNCGGGGSVRA